VSAVFVDTSALFALMAASDQQHDRAKAVFARLRHDRTKLTTTSYVLVETYALVRRRLGARASEDFRAAFAPLLDVTWIDEDLHERALDHLEGSAAGRKASLVDAASFVVMRAERIDRAFTFDGDFEAEGFRTA